MFRWVQVQALAGALHSRVVLAVCLGSNAATIMFHCGDDIVQTMSGAWFPPDATLRTEAQQLNLGFSQSESP